MLLPKSQVVAAVQFAPKLLDVQKNLALALQLVFEAALKGAKLIVLPELCLSGFALRDPREASACAQVQDGYQTEAFRPVCERFGCHVVFGYVELREGNLYNSAAIVGPCGLERSFQKHNLWGNDNVWAKPSEQQSGCVLTAAGRTGVLICRDAMNTYRESYQLKTPRHKFYPRGSVDTICLLAAWGGDYGYPDSAWVELVEESGSNVIVSNRYGNERDLRFKGGSAILDRQRRIYTYGSSFTSEAIVGGVVLL